jgi:hypothetical protein
VYDFVFAPLRMALVPDAVAEKMGLTSLRGERFAAVLPVLRGKVLDIGAGDNVLVRLYRQREGDAPAARESVGVDVVDWGAGCVIIESSARLPFPDESFDCVTFIACINHIPERQAAYTRYGGIRRTSTVTSTSTKRWAWTRPKCSSSSARQASSAST